uniref:Enoyl reductase (ER) domain-containing protein n=1 Tax=Mycena chlorophos TaxID=658473 RepID=A0ABQ0MC07_MYCCL|nr:predicted protein [Mycena chlorophos]
MSSVIGTVFKGSASDGIVEAHHEFAPVKNTQVLVRITHSGVCGTDEHYKHADMVLGHEGVGIVDQIGEGVTSLAVGDVVGWGYLQNSCGKCEQCLNGDDNYCREPGNEMFGFANFHQGSFGTYAVWEESYLFKIPASIPPEYAAPLMCGGATVFEIIDKYIKPTSRVGVVALGGLGHLAVQFLAALGADVVVFSSTDAKRDEALSLGAKEFYATRGLSKLDGVKPMDHLIVTTSFIPDWSLYFSALKPRGSIYPLTVGSDDLRFPNMTLIERGIRVQGSIVASRASHRRMIEFAARNDIKPIIEKFPMSKAGVEQSMQKLREGKVRYRAVLVV